MNILYCGDCGIEDGLIISILSLLKNTENKLCIYVLTAEIEEKNIKALGDKVIDCLDKIVKKKNEKSFVKKIDITSLFLEELPISNMDTRFTPCCMLRLFADKLFQLPNKILYLDNDVVCRKNPEELYNIDISDYHVAGALDHYGKWFFKKNVLRFDYLNSGVLLMNLKNIRKDKTFEKARKMCIQKNMFLPDQSAINKSSNKKLIIKRKYNEQKRIKEDTIFQHFTTTFVYFPYIRTRTIKPWNVEQMHNVLKNYEYDDILKKYLLLKGSIENER